MKGLLILLVFFVMFTVASLLVPLPMFPGNVFCSIIGSVGLEYFEFLSALFNGVFYGVVCWLFFLGINRRLGGER